MFSTDIWLNSLITKKADSFVLPDQSITILLDLYNQGYDRVEWKGSDRCIADADTEEICRRYNDAHTTWTLRDFLCITSGYSVGIPKTAAKYDYYTTEWDMLREDQKQDILKTPTNSFRYACAMDYVNLPDEVYNSIARNGNISGNFIYRWLKEKLTDNIPQVIVDSAVADPDGNSWVYYIIDNFRSEHNLPHEFDKFLSGGTSENTHKDRTEGHTYTEEDSDLPDFFGAGRAPIYSHSHVGCKCFLKVYKSTDPSDMVIVNVNGLC